MKISCHKRKANLRKSFGKISEVMRIPNLIVVQKNSYTDFLLTDVPFHERGDRGLNGVFNSIFPIKDYNGKALLEYVKYEFDAPKNDIDECKHRGLTYSASMRLTLRLIVFETDQVTGVSSVKDVKEQEVYIGDIPFMTLNGTFIINGTERVIVSQVHRSPGVLFDHDKGKSHQSGKILFSAHVIPYRGSWLDFHFDVKDQIYCRVDRKRKFPVTVFLKALGFTDEAILAHFYKTDTYTSQDNGWSCSFSIAKFKGQKLQYDLTDIQQNVLFKEGQKITQKDIRAFGEEEKSFFFQENHLLGKFLAKNIFNSETGEILAEAGAAITDKDLKTFQQLGINRLEVLDIDNIKNGGYIRETLVNDKCVNSGQALIEIYRILRPGEPPAEENAKKLINSLFFDPERYDLSSVGRVKLNMRLDLDSEDTVNTLTIKDIIETLKILHELRDGRGEIDDIDHLGNRRVRSVGELMENQYRLGLVRMEKAVAERMSSVDPALIMPQDLINMKPVVAVIREFFGTSQLSQFMDQTNPLSEITHKRRLSALGPGGLSRERAGFEVRDVHPSHYGRICPIETPEGPNIGLINSLATFARINKYGFIETPYRKVSAGKVTDEVHYLSALEEVKFTIAQANAEVDAEGAFVNSFIQCRKGGDQFLENPDRIDYIDVSPKQLVSVAASLIPFLENDDANRALMGSNMQRQAVPLVHPEAPFVGTGMEKIVAFDSGAVIIAKNPGVVEYVDSQRIIVRTVADGDKSPGVDIYRLLKFQRSNQSTCINQVPLVSPGDYVERDDVIADGPATENGELALGKNVLVAFMPWEGYNFEDSILLSERVVKDDVFTSVHIEEFEISSRDTKLGSEEITRDIPNVSDEALRHLDEAGIVYVGAKVNAGDVLIGKITPKGESLMTPEEKLLRAIFGEKACDVKDTSLRVPPGISGTVVEVRLFNRYGLEKDERAKQIELYEIEKILTDKNDEINLVKKSIALNAIEKFENKVCLFAPAVSEALIGNQLTRENLEALPFEILLKIKTDDEEINNVIHLMRQEYDRIEAEVEKKFNYKIQKIRQGDDLPPGVMKMVKVFIAVKRKIQPGDKMAGRHGNKGVVSKIVPLEDMPFLEDGTPVDMVLNPLGVPSRMNVGQILETHLGWAAKNIGMSVNNLLTSENISEASNSLRDLLLKVYGKKDFDRFFAELDDKLLFETAKDLVAGMSFATPVFDGASEKEISELLQLTGADPSGQVTLYDGKSGVSFDRNVTVGYIYMLKLHHLVDDKIHARSVGPYSLVTQQPLGGKAQFGGQRLGEMEVWALQAYGAAYTLQEMLTVKSDDVAGRTKVYEAIVRGDNNFEAGVPESFNVLVKEMRSLCLNIELCDVDEAVKADIQ